MQFYCTPPKRVMMASYDLTLDDMHPGGHAESKAVRRTVLQKIKDLEGPKQLSTIEILSSRSPWSLKGRLLLTAQVEQKPRDPFPR